jgi:hypothetical protein
MFLDIAVYCMLNILLQPFLFVLLHEYPKDFIFKSFVMLIMVVLALLPFLRLFEVI